MKEWCLGDQGLVFRDKETMVISQTFRADGSILSCTGFLGNENQPTCSTLPWLDNGQFACRPRVCSLVNWIMLWEQCRPVFMMYSVTSDIVNEVSKNTIGQYLHMAMAFKLEEWTSSLFHYAYGWLFIPVHLRSLVSSINFWHVSNRTLQKCNVLASGVSVYL